MEHGRTLPWPSSSPTLPPISHLDTAPFAVHKLASGYHHLLPDRHDAQRHGSLMGVGERPPKRARGYSDWTNRGVSTLTHDFLPRLQSLEGNQATPPPLQPNLPSYGLDTPQTPDLATFAPVHRAPAVGDPNYSPASMPRDVKLEAPLQRLPEKRKFHDAAESDRESLDLAPESYTFSPVHKNVLEPAVTSARPIASPRRHTRSASSAQPLPLDMQSSMSKLQQWPLLPNYTGLMTPVENVREWAFRTENNPRIKNNNCIDDSEGYYLVIPDAGLSSRYRISKVLGHGTFGKVVEANEVSQKDPVAIKIIRSVPKYREAAKQEVRVLRTLRANDPTSKYRCLNMRDCFEFHKHVCIVTDLLGPSLFDFLKSNGYAPFPFMQIQNIAKQILTSVAFFHDLNIIHTDLKPENILLRDAAASSHTFTRVVKAPPTCANRFGTTRQVLKSCDVKIIDFGSAAFADDKKATVVSTRHYRAPEAVLGLEWSFSCDMWSVGCILIELLTGNAIFQTHDNIEHLAMMQRLLGRPIDAQLVEDFETRRAEKPGSPR